MLLSPACASFDQFANFEARGDAFRVLVAEWLSAADGVPGTAWRGEPEPWCRERSAAPSPTGCVLSIAGCSGSFVALMVIGLVMALAASPAVAERLNLSTFHFVDRQALMLRPDRDPDDRDLVPVAAPRAAGGASARSSSRSR